MRSKLLSVVFCVLAFAMTMVFVVNIINPGQSGPVETKETLSTEVPDGTSAVLPTAEQPEPAVTAQTVTRTSKELEDMVKRLAYSSDKSYISEFGRLAKNLKDCAGFLSETLSDSDGSAYLTLISNTLSQILSTPFADNSSFQVRMAQLLNDIDVTCPPTSPSEDVVYPKFDTSPGGELTLAMLSVYRQQINDGKVFTVSVGGKLTVGDAVTDVSSPFEAAYASSGDDAYPLGSLSPLLSTDGLSICSLSNVLTDNLTPAQGQGFSAVRGKPAYARALRNAGIDLVVLAGSHVNDYGDEGIADTQTALNDAGLIMQTASGSSSIESPVGKVTVLSFDIDGTSGTFNSKDAVTQAKNEGAAVVIVVFKRTTTDKQPNAVDGVMTKSGRAAIDNGADLVVFFTQDAIQGISVYKDRYIVYSPAVLYDSTQTAEGTGSFIFQQSFTLNGGAVSASKLSITPVNNGGGKEAAKLLVDSSAEAVIDQIVAFSDNRKYIGDGIARIAIDFIVIKK
ncbi:MAG: CapA family protein [Clostridia bacterium]|nr:CapA family protein [Clostridia bacterium]